MPALKNGAESSPFRAGPDKGARLRVMPVFGTVLLASDLTTERDIRHFVPPQIAACATRIPFANPTTPENVRNTLPHLADAAALIAPEAALSAIYFSCTSASATLGEVAIRHAIAQTRPGVPVVTPVSAAAAAITALGSLRPAILNPYISETGQMVIDAFSALGMELAGERCLGMANDQDMARMDADTLTEIACETLPEGADALFISCTALPAAQLAGRIEKRLGVPVLTSNLAALWACLRLSGFQGSHPDGGTLMTLPLPADSLDLGRTAEETALSA